MFNIFKRKTLPVYEKEPLKITLGEWLNDNMKLSSDVYIFVRDEDNKGCFKQLCRCIPCNITLELYKKYKDTLIESIYIIKRYNVLEYNIYLSEKI